jgi:large subunit ribosomal protein L10
MERTLKSQVVTGLVERLAKSPNFYLTDFTGLRVKQMTELRRRLRRAGLEYVVVKNTLALRALKESAAGAAGLDQHLAGPTGLVFAGADPVAAAKVIGDFHREFYKPGEDARPAVKAGIVEGRAVTSDEVKRLALLPPREVMLGQMAGALQAPLQGFLGAMNGLLYQWVGALEALRSQRATAA